MSILLWPSTESKYEGAFAHHSVQISPFYGDQLANLTQAETDRAFSDYLADAQKRLEHDQQFPGEPKQVRPGEEIQFIEGANPGDAKQVQVSGQIAVMAINERLLNAIMDKNPDLSFALEESFPLPSTQLLQQFQSRYPNLHPVAVPWVFIAPQPAAHP